MISIVGATVAGGWEQDLTIAVPGGAEPGDRLFVFAGASDEVEITSQPAEWSVLLDVQLNPGASTHVWVFSRIVAEEDPGQYTVVWEGTHWHQLQAVLVRGVERIRTQEAATTTGVNVTSLAVPVVEAQDGDHLLVGGYHWDEVTKRFEPDGLETIEHQERGWITGHQPLTETGPTPSYEVTNTVEGLLAAITIVLVPPPPPPEPFTFPLDIRTEIQTADGWVDISEDVRDTEEVVITRGRADEATTADASQCTLTLDNRDGKYSPRNPLSPYFRLIGRNTPLRVSLVSNGLVLRRFCGEVAEWPMTWDLSGNDVTAAITANGVLRRLNRGTRPPRSALRRFINAASPVAYWPLTDGEESAVAAPDKGPYPMGVLFNPPSGSLMLFRARMAWQSGTLAPWMEDVAATPSGAGEDNAGNQGRITGRVDTHQVSNDWAVDLVRAGAGGSDRLVVRSRAEAGITQEWGVRFDRRILSVVVFARTEEDDEEPPSFTELSSTVEPRFFMDQLRHVRFRVTDTGDNSAAWSVWIDGEMLASGTTALLSYPRPVTSVQYWWDHRQSIDEDAEATSLGHIAVWDEGADITPPSAWECAQAMYGHRGERAGIRIERIAREEGIPFEGMGDLEYTVPVGPQETESPLDVMRAAEAVDDGVLHESRDRVAILYRAHRSTYTQRSWGLLPMMTSQENGGGE